MDLKKIQKLVLVEYRKNGYEELWNRSYRIASRYGFGHMVDLAEVGLFCSEVGEAMEDIRQLRHEHMGEELADIVIRVLNFANRKGIDIEAEIRRKNRKNLKRPKLHGKHM